MKRIRRSVMFLGEVWEQFLEDEVLIRAASVAFFAALSLASLVLLFVGLSELIGAEVTQVRLRRLDREIEPDEHSERLDASER